LKQSIDVEELPDANMTEDSSKRTQKPSRDLNFYSVNQSINNPLLMAENANPTEYVRFMDETLASYTGKIERHNEREREKLRLT
jgi:hypothetical protein